MLRRIALIAAVTVVFAGCTRQPGGIAPSDLPIPSGGYQELGRADGSDCNVLILGLLPVSSNLAYKALQDARKDREGTDALVGITVDVVSKYFILWSQTCTEVRGTAVKFN